MGRRIPRQPALISQNSQGGWVIIATLFVALILTIMPMPALAGPLRPPWTLLVLLYWSLALPNRVGIGVAWMTGLLQDVLVGTLLGAHGLAFAVAVYLSIQLYQRIRNFPLWQQAIPVLLLLLLVRLILLWIQELTGAGNPGWPYWLPAVTGTLLWPVVFSLLRFLRRYHQVT